MSKYARTPSARERLVHHVHRLEELEEAKAEAAQDIRDAFSAARSDGFDAGTLRAVLRLRKMTPAQRREKRALEAIYLASLGMLEGEPLPEEARRRLDEDEDGDQAGRGRGAEAAPPEASAAPRGPAKAAREPQATPAQSNLPLKDPEEARQEGRAAAAAQKRIYDNPYPAGDPCRAAWDEGWCERNRSHGMETPEAYRRRTPKKPGEDSEQPGQGDA